jgi:sugar lactone lactonase YvrE
MSIRTKRVAFLTLLPVLSVALFASACMWGVVRNADTGTGIQGATVSYTDSYGHTGSTTSGAGGLYFFDSATGPIPSAGSVDIEVSAPGFATLATTVNVLYNDNPNATLTNLSSFWQVQSFDLQPEAVEGTINTLLSGAGFPVGAVYDEDGNLYFSERDTCRVRKLNTDSGTVTNVAGNGTCGYAGDDGPATAAELDAPSGLALDDDGNLAIVDTENCRIRMVDLHTHEISTVAGNGTCGFTGDGGPAVDAELGLADAMVPSLFVWSDVAFDAGGNLYIADIFNCRIRKVGGGTITTIAGSGATGFTCGAFSGDGGPATSARLNQPSSVAVGGSGKVFIGELAGCRVRRVSSGGTISTIAGTGTCTPSGNGGDAVDAGLANVRGMALDDDGNLFISQFGFSLSDPTEPRYCQVRRIDTGGTIEAVAGTNTCGFSGDGGVAEDAKIQTPGDIALACNGNLAFTSALDDRIRVVFGVNEGGPAPGNLCP